MESGRTAWPTTLPEDNAIAAMTGESRMPNKGKSGPAASGTQQRLDLAAVELDIAMETGMDVAIRSRSLPWVSE